MYGNGEGKMTDKESLKSAEQFFLSAIESNPTNARVRAAYATFLWKGVGDRFGPVPSTSARCHSVWVR